MPNRLSRRAFLGAASAALVAAKTTKGVGQAPAIVGADSLRPSTAFGATAGDVDVDRAMVWSRTDRPSRLVVEYSTTESFTDLRRIVGPAALEATDFTARVELPSLPEHQRIFYRVRFQNLSDLRVWSEPVVGSFTTPARSRALDDVTIAWTADTVGQGWGINPDLGGHAALRGDARSRCGRLHSHRRHDLR